MTPMLFPPGAAGAAPGGTGPAIQAMDAVPGTSAGAPLPVDDGGFAGFDVTLLAVLDQVAPTDEGVLNEMPAVPQGEGGLSAIWLRSFRREMTSTPEVDEDAVEGEESSEIDEDALVAAALASAATVPTDVPPRSPGVSATASLDEGDRNLSVADDDTERFAGVVSDQTDRQETPPADAEPFVQEPKSNDPTAAQRAELAGHRADPDPASATKADPAPGPAASAGLESSSVQTKRSVEAPTADVVRPSVPGPVRHVDPQVAPDGLATIAVEPPALGPPSSASAATVTSTPTPESIRESVPAFTPPATPGSTPDTAPAHAPTGTLTYTTDAQTFAVHPPAVETQTDQGSRLGTDGKSSMRSALEQALTRALSSDTQSDDSPGERPGGGQRESRRASGELMWMHRSSALESRLAPPPSFVMPGTAAVQSGVVPAVLPPVAHAGFAQAFDMPAPAENLSRLVQSMRVQARDGVSEASVRLNPEHLGEVTIAIRVEHGNVSATVRAEAGDVRQWLRGQEDAIRAALAEQGLTLDELVVEQDGQRRQQGEQEAEQRSRRNRLRGRPVNGPSFEVTA